MHQGNFDDHQSSSCKSQPIAVVFSAQWRSSHSNSCRVFVFRAGCAQPPAVQHGDLVNRTEANRDSFPVGTVLTYGCEPGYTADGPTSIICDSSGSWFSQAPRCIQSNGEFVRTQLGFHGKILSGSQAVVCTPLKRICRQPFFFEPLTGFMSNCFARTISASTHA